VEFLELDIDPEPWRGREGQNPERPSRVVKKRGVCNGTGVVHVQNHSKVELGSVKHDEDSDKFKRRY
jgi:hypothetical protein